MSDVITKPKLQLRTGTSVNGDKTPSPATKLLINHGKPNFTIQRSPKIQQNDNGSSSSPQYNYNNNNNNSFVNTNGNNNNNDIIVKSTKFNGVFKPSNISLTEKQPHQQSSADSEASKIVLRRTKALELLANQDGNNNQQQNPVDNEATKVVLRRAAKAADPSLKECEDDSVPEFIRRQRRIQERLAKDNVIDFESRRSGYFTHCIISPNSTNRTSFVETMSSPAIVPSLEMPPPQSPVRKEEIHVVAEEKEPQQEREREHEQKEEQQQEQPQQQIDKEAIGDSREHIEEEEVAKAIEEVNKAVAGEDDDNKPMEVVQVVETVVETKEKVHGERADTIQLDLYTDKPHPAARSVESSSVHTESEAENSIVPQEVEQGVKEGGTDHVTIVNTSLELVEEDQSAGSGAKTIEIDEHKQSEHDEALQNDHAVHSGDITISHTNGNDGPRIPTPDPSGELGVNFEPKTVVSFSKDLGSEPNKYPDTVKVLKDSETPDENLDQDLPEMSKLKFDIKTDAQDDVQVTPVLKAE